MNKGVSIYTVLAIIFIVLKLTGLIAWPWWLVLSPIWLSILMGLVVGGIFVLLYRMR